MNRIEGGSKVKRPQGLWWFVAFCMVVATACGSDEPTGSDILTSDLISVDGQGMDAVGDSASEDTGSMDTLTDGSGLTDQSGEDAAVPNDAQAGDTTPGDTGPDVSGLPCGLACSANETCMEGVCVRECQDGLTVQELKEQLSPGAHIVANFCTNTSATHAYTVLPSYEMLELRATSEDNSSEFRLVRWPLYLAEGPSFSTLLSSHNVAGLIETWEVLPAPFLATASQHVLWGYATNTNDLGGTALRVGLSEPFTSTLKDARGIAGGELLGDDDLLTYSFQLAQKDEGLGIYYHRLSEDKVVRVVDDLGTSTGDVVRVGDYLLIGGYSDDWGGCDGVAPPLNNAGSRVFVVSVDDVKSAFDTNSTIYARCNALTLAVEPGFTGLGDGFILTHLNDGAFQFLGLEVHRLTVEPALGQAQLTDSVQVTQGNAFTGGRKMEGADILLLEHAAGFLMIKADYLTAEIP
jgi:hypothetical protein